jgi:hypothetical protein
MAAGFDVRVRLITQDSGLGGFVLAVNVSRIPEVSAKRG